MMARQDNFNDPNPFDDYDTASMWDWCAGLAVQCAALAAIWLAFAWPWLSGAVTIPWDGKAHFAPQIQFLAGSIARGEWPWWLPHVFAGHPQIADPQSMLFSPPMLVLSLVNGAPSPTAIDTAVLLTVLFGGLGVLFYARLLQWHWAAALIAATIFMFGGSMAWRLQHFGQVMSLAYVPFTLVCLWLAIHRGSLFAGLGAGALGAAILLGRDQVGLLAIYILIGFVIYEVLLTTGRVSRIKRAILPLASGLVLGLALIALPLLFTLLLANQSNRPDIDLAGAGAGSLHPALLATAVVANLYGSAGDMADFWGPPSFHWEDTGLFTAQNMGVVYISALGLMAFLYSLVRDRAVDKPVAFFVGATTFALVYALGWFTPVFALLHEWLPGVDKFRRPADATFLACAFLAWPVGYAVHVMIAEAREERDTWQVPVLVGVALIALGTAIAIAAWRGRLDTAWPDLAVGGGLFAATIVTWMVARWLLPIRPLLAGGLLVGLVAGDLVISNGPNGATALPSRVIDMLNPGVPNETIARLKQELATTNAPDRRDRFELYGLGYHWPNASLTHRLPNTLGTNPVRLDWYARATGAGDTVATIEQRQFSKLMPDYSAPLVRMLGLRLILAPDGAIPESAPERTPGGDREGEPQPGRQKEPQDKPGPTNALNKIATIGGHAIYQLPTPLPRALFVTEARAIDFEQALATGELPDVDYARTVLLERAATPPEPQATATRPAQIESPASIKPQTQIQTQIRHYSNTVVTIDVDAPDAGWLVLHDTWHPWWRVEVNGKRQALLRANVIFRAVRVPAGKAEVRFVFKPLEGALQQLMGAHVDRTQTTPKRLQPSARSQ